MMHELILDIKVLIASFDQKVWIKMVLYDGIFKDFACTNVGKHQFVNNFAIKTEEYTKLFKKYHSINDEPAVISKFGKKWYYNNKLHRDNDLPAVIRDNAKEWYHMNLRHRDNGLPAVIIYTHNLMNINYAFYYNGKRYIPDL